MTMTEEHLTTKALDVQLDLLRYYTRTDEGRRYADSIVNSAVKMEGKEEIPSMGTLLHRLVLTGETYAVSEDIVDVLEFASHSIPTFQIEESDLPSEGGFVYLGRPIVMQDKHERPLVIRAFGWRLAVTHRGDQFEMVEEEDRPDDEQTKKALAVLIWTNPLDDRDHMHDEYLQDVYDQFHPACDMLSLMAGVWEIGRSDWGAWQNSSALDLGKFVMSFLRFIDEPWVDYRQMVPSRHLRKRAARAQQLEPAIHVVQLRRSLSHGARRPEGEGCAEWSHRWLVRGHWRNQWYPSSKTHRPRWIPEHVKGPDDKPLIVHDKIFSVDR